MRGLVARSSQVPRACMVSIGAALLNPMDDWNHWYALADEALYRSKNRGGDNLNGSIVALILVVAGLLAAALAFTLLSSILKSVNTPVCSPLATP